MRTVKAKAVFLGTSGSLGIPVIGCSCTVCISQDIKDKRLRPSCLIEYNKKKYLIDAGPDIRLQALKHHVTSLDGVLITHTHFDHVAGLDDLRVYSFQNKKPLPLLASKESLSELKKILPYLFSEDSQENSKFLPTSLGEDFGSCLFEGLPVNYFSYYQSEMKVLGYRFKNFAYVTDIKNYSERIFTELQGLEVLVLSALDWVDTRAHIGLNTVLEICKKIQPKKVYLIHIGHKLGYKITNEKLPEFIRLAYDGLSIDFEV